MPDQSPSPPGPPPPRWEPIDDRLLSEIYTADQAIYPAPLLTYQCLSSWAAACPDLCVCLRRYDTGPGPAADGVVIVLPVTGEYWGRLVAGELREHDVDPSDMFPPAAATTDGAHGNLELVKVGLHVFHVERYSQSAGDARRAPPFTLAALGEVRSRVGERFPSWEVVGYSALTATPEGNRVFKRLGFASRYVEAKADGDEAEMLVREGNDTFISS